MRFRGPDNGSIYGPNSEVFEGSMLGKDCIVTGDSTVFRSRVHNTSFVDSSLLVDSGVSHSHLWNCRVLNSYVKDVNLGGVTVVNALLVGEWSCDVVGLRFDRGVWHREPASAVIGEPNQRNDEPGVKVVISECQDDRYHIGCWCETYDRWTRVGYRERLGKSAGWQPAQVELAFDTFTDWRAIKRR